MDERRDKPSARSIDMDGDIETLLFFKVIQGERDLTYRLVVQSMRDAKCRNHTDRIFVASLHRLLWRHVKPMPFAGNLSKFDIEISRKFVPAHLHRPANYVGMSRRLALTLAPSTPPRFHRQPSQHRRFTRSDGGATSRIRGVRRIP